MCDMDSEESKGSGYCVEERPDDFYVVRGDKATGPYDALPARRPTTCLTPF